MGGTAKAAGRRGGRNLSAASRSLPNSLGWGHLLLDPRSARPYHLTPVLCSAVAALSPATVLLSPLTMASPVAPGTLGLSSVGLVWDEATGLSLAFRGS